MSQEREKKPSGEQKLSQLQEICFPGGSFAHLQQEWDQAEDQGGKKGSEVRCSKSFPGGHLPAATPSFRQGDMGSRRRMKSCISILCLFLHAGRMQPLTPSGKVDGEKQQESPRSGRVSRPPSVTFAVTLPGLPLAPAELPSPWQMGSWF